MSSAISTYPVRYGTATVDAVRIFYREMGNRGCLAVVLLHDFKTSRTCTVTGFPHSQTDTVSSHRSRIQPLLERLRR
jgi:hypothetical protein